MATDLERAYSALKSKNPIYSTLFDYADGNQPLVYSTNRLKEAFNNISAKFSQNWMSVVIDSAVDRLTFNGWATKTKAITDRLQQIFEDHEIVQDAYDIHRGASITRESFAIVWKNDDGEIELNYNDPRLCHMFYNADNPKKQDFACKWYRDGDVYRMILYYRDRLEYYRTNPAKNLVNGIPSSAKMFMPDPDRPSADNLYGKIPVFHFYLSRNSKGDLYNIITLQDAVNKLFSDMMVAGEFAALKQRYVITSEDTSALKNAPNEIWQLPEGSQAGQFESTPLDTFLDPIDKIANSIAIISRTPKHYFYNAGAGISGEALLAMEAPLTKKVDQRKTSFSATWKRIGQFLLKLDGIDYPLSDIETVWEPTHSIQPKTEADTVKVWVDSGVPLSTSLSWAGKTDEEIEAMEKDKAKEKEENASMARVLLETARIRQDQSNQLLDEQNEEME
jgi:SPP1 family phage portal protein